MFGFIATILVGILLPPSLVAEITSFPASFHTQMVPTNATSLYIRVASKGPAAAAGASRKLFSDLLVLRLRLY